MKLDVNRAGILASLALLLALALYVFLEVLRCPETCLIDHVALRGTRLGKLELIDARLNTWILAWVQRCLLSEPTALFDTNIFYPARNTLTQSEHMLTVAALTLPLRLVTSEAVAVHQAAIFLSSLLLALTTFAFTRWLTGSSFAAVSAGAASMLMPWRLAEISHVQLLNVQWFPLVWLYTGRIVYGEATRSNVVLLSLFLTLQLLSSFYLSYYLLFSCALLVAVLWMQTPFQRRAAAGLAKACVVPATLLLLVAIPYLRWKASTGLLGGKVFESAALIDALALTLPDLELGLLGRLPRRVSYYVPLAVFALGAIAPVAALRARDSVARRRRAFALALTAVVLGSFIMALGRELRVGDLVLPLPGSWAAALVPGYENLRNPLRWTITIGVAFPVLAGLGIAELERRVASHRRLFARGGIALALLLSMPLVQLPTRDAWYGRREPLHRLYGALEALPWGPVMEIPWPLQVSRSVDLSTRYMLGSTLHWRPITNGMSGYVPPSFLLLRQIAQGLPGGRELRRIRELTGVRWIVIHGDLLLPRERAAWEQAVRSGVARKVWSGERAAILELTGWEEGGRYVEELVSPRPRARTFAGISRAPLELAEGDASLSARLPERFRFIGARRLPALVTLRIDNRSDLTWPGFDVQSEGLVHLRYVFLNTEGAELAEEATVMLAEDVPARSSVILRVPVHPPARAGMHRLRMDLVQRLDGEDRPLPVAPVELEAEVRSLAATDDSPDPS